MISPQRRTPSPPIARLRILVLLLALAFVAFIALRGIGDPDTPPQAGATTTTGIEPEDEPDPTEPGQTTEPGTDTTPAALPPLEALELEVIDSGYQHPTAVRAPVGDDRLFIVQRVGVIRIIDAGGNMLDPAFLPIDDRVLAGGIEQGLLGLAFHPEYELNGRFFVYYINRQGQRVVSEFAVDPDDPNRADPDSERILIQENQPPDATDIRHYAGDLHFGPDGYLWISSGDGADARNQGQNPHTIFAALLRIDVDTGDPYDIPADNPFADGVEGAPEVWAYGLRNPFRFSIDHVDGMVYIGDVGQESWEIVNAVPIDEGGGYNFGWANVEGPRCFFETECDPNDYTRAIVEYENMARNPEDPDHPIGCTVIGGMVYRGTEIPELQGHYFYTDWCGGWVRSFRYQDGEVTEVRDWTEGFGDTSEMHCSAPPSLCINSFGEGGDGELYFVTHSGYVVKLVPRR